jgi:hypothetical protein
VLLTIEAIPTPVFAEGEPVDGPWLRVTCADPFVKYECCVEGDECAQALGEKIQRLVLTGSD